MRVGQEWLERGKLWSPVTVVFSTKNKSTFFSLWTLGHVPSVSLSISLCSSIVQIITGLVSGVVVIFMVLVGHREQKCPHSTFSWMFHGIHVLVGLGMSWTYLNFLVQFLLVLQYLTPEQSPPCVWCWALLFRAHISSVDLFPCVSRISSVDLFPCVRTQAQWVYVWVYRLVWVRIVWNWFFIY